MNYGVLYLSLSLYVHGWPLQGINRGKKGYDRFHWSFAFLRMPLPSFCVQSNLNRKHGFSGLSASTLTELQTQHISLVLDLGLAELPGTVDPLGFSAQGASQRLNVNGAAETSRHSHSTCCLCSCPCSIAPSDFTYKIQVQRLKIIKNFKMAIAEHQIKFKALLNLTLRGCTIGPPIKPALRVEQTQTESNYVLVASPA